VGVFWGRIGIIWTGKIVGQFCYVVMQTHHVTLCRSVCRFQRKHRCKRSALISLCDARTDDVVRVKCCRRSRSTPILRRLMRIVSSHRTYLACSFLGVPATRRCFRPRNR
jgi:hypothetical protein